MPPTPELQEIVGRILATAEAEMEARQQAETWAAEALAQRGDPGAIIAKARTRAAQDQAGRLAQELADLRAQAMKLIQAPLDAKRQRALKRYKASQRAILPEVRQALKVLWDAGATLYQGHIVPPDWIEPREVHAAFESAEPKPGTPRHARGELRRIESAPEYSDPHRILNRLLTEAASRAHEPAEAREGLAELNQEVSTT